ncbi:MAG: methyltransferase [Actinomycetota bacterium]
MGRSRRRRINERLRLNRLAIGGWAAQSLFAANELGLFDLLARKGPLDAAAVAGELGTDVDSTRRLLGALTAIDLLKHVDGDRFENTYGTNEFLVPGKAESMTTWVSLIGQWNQTFAKLPESVRTGEPAEVPEEHLGQSDDYTRRFIIGMHDYAVGFGRELARHLDLSGSRRLLDIGGGPGTYSVLLAEANPDLRCTVFDLPEVVAIAREVIAEHGLSDRIDTASGDYHTDQPPGGYDTALVSNTLHQEDDDTCVSVLRKAHDALEPGGMCVVHAMFLNEEGDGPLWPALHNLLMLLVYRGGRAYSVGQTEAQLIAAGFADPEHHRMSFFNAGSFVTARKPS